MQGQELAHSILAHAIRFRDRVGISSEQQAFQLGGTLLSDAALCLKVVWKPALGMIRRQRVGREAGRCPQALSLSHEACLETIPPTSRPPGAACATATDESFPGCVPAVPTTCVHESGGCCKYLETKHPASMHQTRQVKRHQPELLGSELKELNMHVSGSPLHTSAAASLNPGDLGIRVRVWGLAASGQVARLSGWVPNSQKLHATSKQGTTFNPRTPTP